MGAAAGQTVREETSRALCITLSLVVSIRYRESNISIPDIYSDPTATVGVAHTRNALQAGLYRRTGLERMSGQKVDLGLHFNGTEFRA